MIATKLHRHRRLVYLGTLSLIVLGGFALQSLASSIYPDVAFPRITVIAEAGEDSVENIELGITRPLEQSVSVVQGVHRVRSRTLRGACEMQIDFEPSVDMPQALQEVRTRIGQIQSSLPPDVKLTVERQTPSVFPVISFHVRLDPQRPSERFKETADLYDWALLEIKPRLARQQDVFLVTIQSGDVHEIVVEPDPSALSARGLGIADVSAAIDKTNKVGVVGRLDRGGKRFQVLVTGQLLSLEELENVAVPAGKGKAVRLADIAKVHQAVADRTSVITGDGHDAVVVNVFMRSGGRVTELSKKVAAIVEDERAHNPGLLLTPVYDQANLVNASLQGVRDAIVLGAILCVVVLMFFLRDIRTTLAAAPSIPLAILATFALMPVCGITLNLMSLGGVAVAIGLVVDDAIVVIECIARHRALGESRVGAVDKAVHEVAGAVFWSSLTTIAVHGPLVLLEGVLGQFLKALSITIVLAIVFSFVISLTLMPVLALGPLGGKEHTGEEGGQRLAAFYGRAATWLLSHRIVGWVLLALVLAGVGAFAYPSTVFLPEMDEGAFVLDYDAPVGTALAETDARVRVLEAAVIDSKANPEVRSFSRRTGQELGIAATEAWRGDLLVSLKPRGERKATCTEVMDRLRHRLEKEVPQLHIEFAQLMKDTLNDLMGQARPIEVKIFGRDHRQIADAVGRARQRIAGIPGLVELSRGATFGSPEIFFRMDPALSARRNVTADEVEGIARAALLGVEATRMRQGDRLVPVRVRWPDLVRFDSQWMDSLPIEKDGKTFPISVVSSREEHSNPNELVRENQQPVGLLTGAVEQADLGTTAAAVEKALADLPRPEGVRIEYGGQIESARAANKNLLFVLGIGIFLIIVLLVAQFRSFGRAFVVFLALPFSQVGGLVALRMTGLPLNISSFMGLIMLVGLVVKNGILLVDYAERLRDEGLDVEEAVIQAGRVRLRPILMTSLTAIMGLIPLALNVGAGAELQQPLAVAMIGGLSLSTVFTLAVVPLAMVLFARKPLPVEEAIE